MLRTVEEHNGFIRAARRLLTEARLKTGVACPGCGQELLWQEVYAQTLQYPPPTTRPARCAPCGITIQLEA